MTTNPLRGSRDAVIEALVDVGRALGVDGYRLDVDSATASDLQVSIAASEGACEECLAPAEVLKEIISGGLDGAYLPGEIDLRLPAPTTGPA